MIQGQVGGQLSRSRINRHGSTYLPIANDSQIASPHLLVILHFLYLGLNYPITTMADQLVEETLRYGSHSLQTITVATVPNGLATGLWVVYVHTPESVISSQ